MRNMSRVKIELNACVLWYLFLYFLPADNVDCVGILWGNQIKMEKLHDHFQLKMLCIKKTNTRKLALMCSIYGEWN